MSINQNKNKIFTKGLTNTEADVLSIVKRFFENNPGEIYGSIDNIILTVLRQVKEDLINGTLVPSVSSVNGKIGVVTISSDDVGAEPKITKNTAFNKNFGTEEGTVCEGNDPRLSDARTPKSHTHSEYITSDMLDKAFENYLSRNGITIGNNGSERTITIKGNVVIKDGQIMEEYNG